jgi:hypothetical protein
MIKLVLAMPNGAEGQPLELELDDFDVVLDLNICPAKGMLKLLDC